MIIYKYRFRKLKYINDFKQCSIPGVIPQKHIELFTNWHKHIPMEYQDLPCPISQTEILGR